MVIVGVAASPMVRDMRMSSAQLWGETGASSSAGSLHFGFHSHLQPREQPSAPLSLLRQRTDRMASECNDGAPIHAPTALN